MAAASTLVIAAAVTLSVLGSPDGTLIATGHFDGTVRLWAVEEL